MTRPRANMLIYAITGLSVVIFAIGIFEGGGNHFWYPPFFIYFAAAGLLSVSGLYFNLFCRRLPSNEVSKKQGFQSILDNSVPSINAIVAFGSSLALGVYLVYALEGPLAHSLAVGVPCAISFGAPRIRSSPGSFRNDEESAVAGNLPKSVQSTPIVSKILRRHAASAALLHRRRMRPARAFPTAKLET